MLTTITIKGISGLTQSAYAPFWRKLATLAGVRPFDLAAVAVTFFCILFVARRLTNRGEEGRSWFEPFLAASSAVAIPFALQLLTGVSLFWLAVMFAALSLALAVLLGPGRFSRWAFVASGAFGAAATCEGGIGAFGALFVVGFLAASPRFRKEGRLFAPIGWWFLGFGAALLCGWFAIELPLTAFLLPTKPQAIFGFLIAGLIAIPLVAVVHLFERRHVRRALSFWGLFVATALALAWVLGREQKISACEVFARTVLNDLGTRKVIVGGSSLDFVVRAFLPEDVRFVGGKSVADREYLLNLDGSDEEVSRDVLFLSDYYRRPVGLAAFAELGVPPPVTSPFGIREALKIAAKSSPTNLPPEVVAAINAYTNALTTAVPPLSRSLDEMLVGFAEIPQVQRVNRMNVAREQIRRAWALGLAGLKLSATLLSLDIMLGDGKAMESDSLTALFINRNDPAANAVLGGLRLQQKRLDDAERYLRRSVEHGGGSTAYNNLAMVLVKTDRGGEGVSFAQKAVEMDPWNWNVRETLAQTLICAGDIEASKAALEAMCDVARGPDQAYKARQCADRACARLIEQVRAKGGDAAVQAFGAFRDRLEEKLKAAEKKPEA